ncbi:DUF2231 domain-containing protein [Nocardioides antri]|uniref:DUF2231 domain-containing protein n=1 Tax=Nocardioides antri TaxID=2607659 RepID=A0A5B1M7V8_9ACTN|nr:DUF2231 domain-containing protein [Nocardioides antri]KAA1428804.1 hypothetical protein F0U47_00865 [Nocardioides antri]
MEINGLPLHVLVVHAAVVLTPIAGLAAIAYALVPRWRDWLRWPVAVAVVAAVGAVWVAFLSGGDFRDTDRFAGATGEFATKLQDHEDLGGILRWVASGFGVLTLAAVALHDRTGVVRILLSAVVVATAVATVVLTVMTGDSGAQAVWGT